MNKKKAWVDLNKQEKEKALYAFAHPMCRVCERKVQSYSVNKNSICYDCIEEMSGYERRD